jgi:hypothetical protein
VRWARCYRQNGGGIRGIQTIQTTVLVGEQMTIIRRVPQAKKSPLGHVLSVKVRPRATLLRQEGSSNENPSKKEI